MIKSETVDARVDGSRGLTGPTGGTCSSVQTRINALKAWFVIELNHWMKSGRERDEIADSVDFGDRNDQNGVVTADKSENSSQMTRFHLRRYANEVRMSWLRASTCGRYESLWISLHEAGGFQWNCGLVIGRVTSCWVQVDSSGDDLHFIFWVGNDRMKRPHANGRRRTDAVASPAPVPRKLASRRPGWFTWTRNGAAGGPSICIFTRSVQKWAEREAIRGRSSFIRRICARIAAIRGSNGRPNPLALKRLSIEHAHSYRSVSSSMKFAFK